MGQNGRVKAAYSFSWDTIAARTENVYREILA
jgi:glycosyltransferase involved in cell wall biosynthesis